MSVEHIKTWAPLPSTTRATSVHLSYDKRTDRIVYAANKSIFIRSVSNPERSTQYTQHTQSTTVAKFSPSGYYVASGDASGSVRVWDASGEDMITKGEYKVISGRINDLDWDADSQRIIAVGNGKERYGHCFTYDSGNTVGEISGHSGIVNAVSIRPCRPYRAATVSDDSAMVFYTGPPFKFNSTVRGNHSNFVHDIRFSPNGEYIVSVGADRKIALYDGKTGEFKNFIGEGEHHGSIFAVSWSNDSTKFATSSADATVKLWEASSGSLLKTWAFEKVLDSHQVGVVFVGDDKIISLSYCGDLNYLRVSSDTPERVISGHQKNITALKVSADANIIFSGSYDGKVLVWDASQGTASYIGGDGHSNFVVSLKRDSSGKIWSTGWDDVIKTIDGESFSGSSFAVGAQPKALSAKGNLVAVITENNLQVLREGVKCSSVSLPSNATSLSISKDFVAVGSQDNSIRLYNLLDLSPSKNLPSLRAVPTYLSFSSSGALLAAGDSTGKITLYDAETGTVITSRWAFHSGRINSISWHPTDDFIVSGSLDTNVYIYSVKTPSKNAKFLGAHKDGVNAVEWITDSTFVSAGADAAIKWWNVKLPASS
ncbi:WD40 repeat-like protein [Nadsonia fulvescens var. elongata DSM 6958]|uniref:WD40 repeat-like protein n=1 Tax=Nadsonia fulvescens var. elongata DSM 6958 TaxID=857566 RepID=A0A1E3PRD0_9ASCO|nr:WD40 repeat-like protein [Nadsonia fulvescens var. elongata DSM 6958]